ncbi:MAG TPA: histidine triad nucleotide-binding protein [Gemmatimonadaceae bacterium]|jgi:histidine triad (HIT) family protein|nr:histidine triad nucleotide-binding protein [Gemmatimonadaceae bacterium]
MSDDCLFCRLIRGEIPAKIVATSPECVAFRDIDPQAPTHVVIVPRAHIPTLSDVKDFSIVGHMARMATQVAESEGITESGYRVVINTNADGGQTVHHLHLHLLGGRHMTWPPG